MPPAIAKGPIVRWRFGLPGAALAELAGPIGFVDWKSGSSLGDWRDEAERI